MVMTTLMPNPERGDVIGRPGAARERASARGRGSREGLPERSSVTSTKSSQVGPDLKRHEFTSWRTTL